MSKESEDIKAEQVKNQSDAFMQDYLVNLRRGLSDYADSFSGHMDEIKASMDRHRDLVLQQVNEQVRTINERMLAIGKVRKETIERAAKTTDSEEVSMEDIRETLEKMKTIISNIEKAIDR